MVRFSAIGLTPPGQILSDLRPLWGGRTRLEAVSRQSVVAACGRRPRHPASGCIDNPKGGCLLPASCFA